MKEDCIFCKIANGIIPSHTLYEDENFRVIYDIAPMSKGHALILTKKHYDNVYELDDDIASKIFVLAKKMAKAMTLAFECDGFNILQNNKEAAGQTVFHFHMHLVPRYSNDGALKFGTPGKVADEELSVLEEKIKLFLDEK